MSLLDAFGVGHSLTASPSESPKPFPLMPFAFCLSRLSCILFKSAVRPLSTITGVGHNPEPVAAVRGTNGGSWYAMPLRIVPDRGQVSENSCKPPSKQSCDVLHDDVERSKLVNKTGIFRPKAASLSREPCPLSCEADILTGEAATDDIDGADLFAREGSHVMVAGNLRPMFRQHAPAEWIDLAKGDGLESARSLKPKVEPADAGEQ